MTNPSISTSGRDLPTGTVTFLFTDIEGSTRLWQEEPEAMSIAHARHDAILREAIGSNNGHVIQIVGDSFSAAFHTALDGLRAAVSAQRALHQTAGFSQNKAVSLRVRMGLHTGAAQILTDGSGKYEGYATIATAQRVMAAAHGGQVLLTQITHDLLENVLPDTINLRDLGEHRLKDLRSLLRIYQLTTPDLPQDFPAIKSLNVLPNNLPTQLTSFIGREHELTEAKQKLEKARLLTLIGPGGTGKTRLSLQLAADVQSAFPDGVWLVELAPLADPALILQTIAATFNVRAQAGMPLKEIVTDYLRAKHLLLILDNCEHLIEACAQHADQLLRTCPNLKVIVSSREALGINGETVYRVPSLALPDQVEASREALTGYESIQLFVERARAANPRFELTDKNAASVAQICRRLDGIPLALELAAARNTVFPVDQIAARLDDRFKLLTGGSRTALPRQQTLRALIDWSHDMLTEPERILLRRLSVFAGGWTFNAAEALSPDLDVLNSLTQLINKSLVAVDEDDNKTRYRLLETVRQYARDKLLESGEAEKIRNAHLDYFVTFAEIAGPKMDSAEVLEWIPLIDAEYDNFRTAFEWSLDNHVEAALKLVGNLAYFWLRHGHGAEGIRWANTALAHADRMAKVSDPEAVRRQMFERANALQALSFLSYSQGDNVNAFKAGDECIKLARELNDNRLLAIALAFSGSAKLFGGDFDEAQSRIEQAVAITSAAREKYGLGMALGIMAQLAMIKDRDFKTAHKYEQESLALIGENGNPWMSVMMLFGTGRGAMFRGDFAVARERFAKCLPIFLEMGDEHRVNMIRSEFAHMDRYEGNYQQAESEYRKTILIWQKLGHRAAIAHQLESFAFVAKAREQFERAARLLGAAEILRERINIPMSMPEQIEYQREVAELQSNLEAPALAALWAEGRALTMEQAIDYALN